MSATIQLNHAAEIFTTSGPTGRFAEVLHGQVQDAGGNVLFDGTPDCCVVEQQQCRQATKLVPTEWREVAEEVAAAEHLWSLVISAR